MHRKTDSEATSLDAASSPARSPRRYPAPVIIPLSYIVQSPSQHDAEKMSFNSGSLSGSPHHSHHPTHSGSSHYLSHDHFYRCSSPAAYHSRESSTTRFSASFKHHDSSGGGPWRRVRPQDAEGSDDGDTDGPVQQRRLGPRFYALCFVVSFAVLFSAFSLILWGASRAYEPKIAIKSIVFESFNVQAGTDSTGVPTKLLSISSTVRLFYRNSGTFFGVHVSSTPLQFYYYQLSVASGQMEEFYQDRKSQRVVVTAVRGKQVPLYGGGASISSSPDGPESLHLNLTFTVRSRAYILGKLVKPKFYHTFLCPVVLRRAHIGKPVHLNQTCFQEP